MLFAASTTNSLQVGAIAMALFGGLALFLYGMDQMSDALKLVAGDGMKKVLAKLTTNRFTGAIAGAFVTAVIQSSSITTVLVVGFVSAGLMTLSQSTGVIMGANIGTTITAQIIAFKVTQYALVLVAVGFAMQFCLKHERSKHYGHMIMGLGLIFFGMHLMSEGTKPLRTYQPFIEMMQTMDNPLMAILLSAAFTALVQSSSATTGIVIVLASQGFISLDAGIALIFGANIGTCVTAMLASIGKSREAVRAGVVHVVFNVIGVVLWFGLIGQLGQFVTWLSPTYPELTGAERMAAETPRQIANAHTVFNVANTVIFLWLTGPIVWLVFRLVPDREGEPEAARPRYLDELLVQTPSLALDIVRMELGRLGAAAVHMARGALHTVIYGDASDLDKLEQMDNDVDKLHGAIVTYLGRLSQENLSDHQAEQLHDYLATANYIENIGDVIETNLVDTGRRRLEEGLEISQQTAQVLNAFHRKVSWSVELAAVRALVENDSSIAAEVMNAKAEINHLAADAEEHLSRRLAADEPKRLVAFRLESETMEYLKRMYYFAKRIAKVVGEEDLAYAKPPQTAESPTSISV